MKRTFECTNCKERNHIKEADVVDDKLRLCYRCSREYRHELKESEKLIKNKFYGTTETKLSLQ